MFINLVFFAIGLVLLYFGGEKLVEGSVAIAQKLKLSTLLISMVIVGFGTSAPELLVSLQAALDGSSDIALGNVVGSNICNILLILGIALVITPVACGQFQVRRDAGACVVAGIAVAALSFFDVISRGAGFALFAALAGYLTYCILHEKHKTRREEKERKKLVEHLKEEIDTTGMLPLPKASLITFLSLVALVIGAKLLVTGAVAIARTFDISEAVIGLTLVAVGTSLPELATAIVAARRKHGDVIIGNVLGSNLFNILGILGVTAMIKPIPFTGHIAESDVWIMLGVMVALMLAVCWRKSLKRVDGVVYLSAYAAYLVWLM